MQENSVWDEAFAQALVGATVLIGLTRRTPQGEEQTQLWGVVTQADRESGIEVTLSGTHEGEDYWLPPQTDVFRKATPGTYRLAGTGEEVIDPDYTTAWTVTKTE